MSTASTPAPRSSTSGATSWVASLFTLKREGFHPILGIVVAAIAVVLLFVLSALGRQNLWHSVSFGFLFSTSSDGVVKESYRTRVRWSAALAPMGGLQTAVGFLIGGAPGQGDPAQRHGPEQYHRAGRALS